MADANLRRLVEQAQPLQAAFSPTWSSTGSHPLGAGFKANRTYPTPSSGRYELPSSGQAFTDLQAAMSSAPPPVEAAYIDCVWAGLLDKPTAHLPLETRDIEHLARRGVPASPADLDRIVASAMVSVFRSEQESLQGGAVNQARFAGVSVLTMRLAAGSRDAEQAWLQTRWHNSALDLLHDLEQIWPLHRPGQTKLSSKARRVALVVHPEHSNELDPSDAERLKVIASILDLELSVLDRRNVDPGVLRRDLFAGPSAIIALGPWDEKTQQLAADFQSGGPGRIARYADVPFTFDRVCGYLLELAAITHALQPVLDPRPDIEPEKRPPLPVSEPRACRHLGDRVYVLDGATDLWWTRDTAGHADTVFKTYRLVGSRFVHQTDHDRHSKAIPKHKGEVLREFQYSETHACSKKPEKHVP